MSAGELESFRRYIFGTIDQLVASLDGLDETELNWRPAAPSTNSLYAIATHVLGNTEDNLIGTLCGLPFERDRPAPDYSWGGTAEEQEARVKAMQAA